MYPSISVKKKLFFSQAFFFHYIVKRLVKREQMNGLKEGDGYVVNSSITDDLGHRDVTTREARDFAEFS